MAQLPGSNTLSIGYDEGAIMIKLGREQPAITMDNSGKIIWAKHSEIQQVETVFLSGVFELFTRIMRFTRHVLNAHHFVSGMGCIQITWYKSGECESTR